MADVVITASNTIPGTGADIINGTAGEALTIGVPVWLKASDSRYYASDANDATRIFFDGVTVSQAAAAGQPVSVQRGGQLAFGAVFTVTAALGGILIVSANVGKIAPFSDWAAGMTLLVVGATLSTSNALIKPWTPGVGI